MTATKTLLQLAGADLSLPRLGDCCLVLIDLQNEYRAGPIALPDANAAIANAEILLARARNGGAAVFHVAHRGRPGGLFDRTAERGAIVAALAPQADEPVIEKECPTPSPGPICRRASPRPDARTSSSPG
jgi:nicotinamidase-related amidase